MITHCLHGIAEISPLRLCKIANLLFLLVLFTALVASLSFQLRILSPLRLPFRQAGIN
jgi:hypothetical protein